MNETKHTPGRDELLIYAKNLRFYAEMFRQHGWSTVVIHSSVFEFTLEQYATFIEANARLIAAAPDLLEEHKSDDQLLMQMAVVFHDDRLTDFLPCGLIEKVKARIQRGTPAIAKAEGRV